MMNIQDTLHMFNRASIYGLPLGGLTAAAILVGVFTPLGIVTGFAMAAGVMVIGGAVSFPQNAGGQVGTAGEGRR